MVVPDLRLGQNVAIEIVSDGSERCQKLTIPGWHTTIFPPYFVAGAIYSGFGMVLTLLIITRQTMHLERYITMDHLDKMAKVTMFTGMIVSYAYASPKRRNSAFSRLSSWEAMPR